MSAVTPRQEAIFRVLWRTVNALLIVSLLLAGYSTTWEYSVRRYLKGFSDAIVPSPATPEEKIDAILTWIRSGAPRPLAPHLDELSNPRSGNHPELQATACRLRHRDQCLFESIAQRGPGRAPPAATHPRTHYQTRGGGSAGGRPLDHRGSHLSDDPARRPRPYAYSQGFAKSRNICTGHRRHPRLSPHL